MIKDPFEEYIQELEPSKKDKGYAWQTAIGLQAVDGIKPSNYLIETAIKHIDGVISIDTVQELITDYYDISPKQQANDRTEEADKVSVRIAKLLSEQAFSFTISEYLSIHKYLFHGIYKHAGKMRTYNITKKEWILNGETIHYGTASQLKETLEYDLSCEKAFNYKHLTMDESIHHLAILCQEFGKYIFFLRGIHEQLLYFL